MAKEKRPGAEHKIELIFLDLSSPARCVDLWGSGNEFPERFTNLTIFVFNMEQSSRYLIILVSLIVRGGSTIG